MEQKRKNERKGEQNTNKGEMGKIERGTWQMEEQEMRRGGARRNEGSEEKEQDERIINGVRERRLINI